MSHWKTGVKILCSKSWEGQNSMKAKIWGSKFYFFLVEPLVKILCSLKRGVKILYFFPVPWKRGVKTAEPTNQLHWRGAPPPPPPGTWLSREGGKQINRKWVQICLDGWLLTVDCIVYSDIVNTFKSSYLHSILSIVIIETPECQHCIVWQWAAFWAWGNGKFTTINKESLT